MPFVRLTIVGLSRVVLYEKRSSSGENVFQLVGIPVLLIVILEQSVQNPHRP